MSLYSLVLGGVSPVGSLYAGGLADKLGAGITFVISGVIVAIFILGISFTKLGRELKVQEND